MHLQYIIYSFIGSQIGSLLIFAKLLLTGKLINAFIRITMEFLLI